MLTTQILIKNNRDTIEECILSLKDLNCEIIFGDLGSTDGTSDICSDYGKIIKVSGNFDKIRNDLVRVSLTEWQFWINPWEKIVSGQEQIRWSITQEENHYNLYKIENDVIFKELRLWKKGTCKFIRPAYESLDVLTTNQISSVIVGSGNFKIDSILFEWKAKNLNAWDVEYYLALHELTNKNYDKFLSSAKIFIFKSKESDSTVLLRYYMSVVYLFVKRNCEESYQNIIMCLSKYPAMAEFWCLLGDIFFAKNQWNRAVAFYDNAIVFGKRRSQSDCLPIEIKKYKDYPENMIDRCEKLMLRK